ncbi:MAG: hypothetical protein KAI99_16880, partial [Cyclobacteriaceae bacterium]|nr:hypothetical protein [Cyclobacteriaceae bacterium]
AFCKQKGIAKSVFYYWQKRHKEDQSNGGFIPIKVNNGNRIYSPSVIEITYPNGVIVRLPGQTLPAIVRQYLQFIAMFALNDISSVFALPESNRFPKRV